MTSTDFSKELSLLIRSRHPLIFVETEEKDRAESLLLHLADQLKLPFFVWTRTKGLRQHFELATSHATLNALEALAELERQYRPGIYNFQGLAEDLEDKILASKLKDLAKHFLKLKGSIIITGKVPEAMPRVLKALSTVVEMPLPQPSEYRSLLEHLYRDLSKQQAIDMHLTKGELSMLLRGLQGLTLLEAEKILTKAMIEDGQLGPQDIHKVIKAKKDVVEREGLLEYYPVEEAMTDIAGLKGLKNWLAKRRAIILEPEKAKAFGLEFPKGVLLLGVQGCGKSLSAKAVASDWNLPLLKMDPASLYNKYIGETEKNFRRAMLTAEKMAPVVLWIDEIEKAFASVGEMDSGVSGRVLGNFLSWLQDRQGDVFVVATANDVTKLPPELIRKGRFDEIFFVDLPGAEVRKDIFALHLKKRQRDAQAFDLAHLATLSEGFSGAEIEQAVVSALYSAFSQGVDLDTEILSGELRQTVPLSQTMSEALVRLRQWAKDRAVLAS